MFESVDVRPMLPLVQAPTLVMHNAVNPIVGSEHGEFLAKNLPDARFISLPGVGATWDPDDQDVIVAELAEFLTGVRPHRPATRILATVMFTDIVGSTERVAHLGDRDWHALLDAHDRAVREQLERFGGQEIGTTGDGFVSTFEGPARAIRCARAITKVLREIGLLIRVGLHTGECELRRNGDLAGISVHIAARVCALARADETLVTSAGRDLAAGSEITFRDTGDHELKGVPGSWRLYAAEIRGG
jgi:class 3 adenylate cyclase